MEPTPLSGPRFAAADELKGLAILLVFSTDCNRHSTGDFLAFGTMGWTALVCYSGLDELLLDLVIPLRSPFLRRRLLPMAL